MNQRKRRERRYTAEISISFFDVISCGFGAIVLLLLIAKTVDSTAFETVEQPREGSVAELQQQLFQIRGETTTLNRALKSREEQLSDIRIRIAKLQEQLASVQRQKDAVAQVDTTEKDKLTLAQQVYHRYVRQYVQFCLVKSSAGNDQHPQHLPPGERHSSHE